MNFVTLLYATFLLAVVVTYWLIPRAWGRWWLIGASLVFYGSWNPIYAPGFVILLMANWFLGAAAMRRPRLAVTAAVVLDVGLLIVFKYSDWLLGSSASLVSLMTGGPVPWTPVGIVLPLAISFVTFTMLAYVIDIARGYPPDRRLDRFTLFVTFFPHLIAGPIMRGYEFLPQVRHPRPLALVHMRLALPLLVSGLVKKVLGDTLAPTANAVFSDPAAFATPFVWIGILAFGFQIFLDFSGYTDLALGSAHLLGFQLPRNFEWPYRSLSIQEFWRRWHMTLSRWLRDYLYIPLGGSRHGPRRTYLALFSTMLLGGLWHGAGLTFAIWGMWHGIGLAAHRWLRRDGPLRDIPIPPAVAWITTFGFVTIGWVWFRAVDVNNALAVLRQSVAWSGGDTLSVPIVLLTLALVVGQWPGWSSLFASVAPEGSMRRYAAYGAAVTIAILLIPVETVDFIYFQF
jgi:D-alanyl-lipoteichoic acid acyltransferase DltB (MBOAT superfamily)